MSLQNISQNEKTKKGEIKMKKLTRKEQATLNCRKMMKARKYLWRASRKGN